MEAIGGNTLKAHAKTREVASVFGVSGPSAAKPNIRLVRRRDMGSRRVPSCSRLPEEIWRAPSHRSEGTRNQRTTRPQPARSRSEA